MKKFNVEQLQLLRARPRVFGSRVGRLTELIDGRIPVVDYVGNQLGPQVARLTSAMVERLALVHRERAPVLLVFEEDDPARPVIVDSVLDCAGSASPQCEARQIEPETGASEVLISDEALGREPPGSTPRAVHLHSAAQTAQVATIVGVEGDSVLIRVRAEGEATIKAKTAVTLRNLKDPVVVLSLADQQVVIVGQLHDRVPIDPAGAEGADVVLRGSRVVIEADVELVLKAGPCSLHFDARGKAVTTADQIVSRARDTNKVQGGSVQLN